MSRYFIGTLSCAKYSDAPMLKEGLSYIKGQKEIGQGGFAHWQFVCVTSKKARVSFLARLFPTGHFEVTRSQAAMDYVWKEDTRVPGTQFEYGTLPRGKQGRDWDAIKAAAIAGSIEDIPSDVFVRHYGAIKRIGMDFMQPLAMVRTIKVFYGETGVGKSKKAWELAGLCAYPKSPTTKFWDGYQGQPTVVMDEFRGQIGIEHILRWFDRYPVCVETKGGGTVLKATHIYVTSNLHPRDWYPNLDESTVKALMRRLDVYEIIDFFNKN